MAVDIWAGLIGNWATANRWSLGRVPAAGDDVQINKAQAVVSLTAGTAINSLTVGSDARLNVGVVGAAVTLTLTQGFTLTGNMTLNGPSVPRVQGAATVSIGADSTIGAGGFLAIGQSAGGPNGITGAAGTQLTINAGGQLFKNSAQIAGQPSSVVTTDVNGDGLILIDSGTLVLNGALNGIGEFEGTVTNNYTFLGNKGTTFINLHGSPTLSFTTGFQSFGTSSSVVGGLNILENGGLLNRFDGELDVYRITVQAGEMDVASDAAKAVILQITNGNLGGNGTLTAKTVRVGAAGGTGSLGGPATTPQVVAQTTFEFIGNNFRFTVAAGSSITANGAENYFVGNNSIFTLNGDFINNGLTTLGVISRTATSRITGAGTFTNNGQIVKKNAGTFRIDNYAGGGGVKVIAGDLFLNGVKAANAGAFVIAGAAGAGATLELGMVTGAANVSFARGSVGTLKLDHASSFAGTISGFAAGDSIDLADVKFSGTGTGGLSALAGGIQALGVTAAGGATDLRIADGAHAATIALLGQYASSNVALSSDGAGGTLLTYAASPHESSGGVLAAHA